MTPLDLVTAGEALAALVADDGLPLACATSFRRTVAGSEANVAAGLARLGHRAAFVGRVGADPLGDAVAAAVRSWGVEAHLVVDGDAPTGLLVRDAAGHRPTDVAYGRRGSAGSRLDPDDLRPVLSRPCRSVLVTGITAVLSDRGPAVVERLLEHAEAHSALVVLDPNVRLRLAAAERYAELLQPLLSRCGVVLAGEDELGVLVPRAADAVAALHERGVGVVVVKRGARGATVSDGHDVIEVSASARHAVDVVGAGDGFTAGFLSGCLDGVGTAAAAARGAAVAARVVGTLGDVEGLPTRRDLDRAAEVSR